jgi:hypothetical protein
MMITAFGLALAAWLALLMMEFVFAQKLTKYRTDIEPGQSFWKGASWMSQMNVSSLKNYTAEGQTKARWLNALGILRALMMAACVVFFVLAFVLE